jgi:hypothetical protein
MSLRIPRNLLLFGVFTSVGYVAFAAFLPGASSGFLLLNTYAWIFGFRIFANGFRPRWPLASLRILIDTNDLLFAACAFCYWCLFWFGIKLIPGGNEASQSAVAFLALNSVLLPVASHYAVEKSQRGKFILFYLMFGFVLILSVVAMELDSTAAELGEGLARWLSGLKLAVTAPRTFWYQVASNFSAAISWISIPAICFILAISLEALGDYFATRREEIDKTFAGADLSRLQLKTAEIVYVRKFIRKQPLAALTEATRKVENEQLGEIWGAILALYQTASPGATLKEEQELSKELTSAHEEARGNIEFLNRIQKQIEIGGERTVTRHDCRRLFKIAEERCWPDMIQRSSAESKSDLTALAQDNAKHAGSDLMAVLGLALAIVIFFATGATLPDVHGTEIIGAVVGTIMLGALGSSARILFITPMIRREGATAALVPPVYAVRPTILLLTILAVQALGIADWLATSGIAPAASKLSVDHNEGWFAGAVLAGATAIAVWMVSAADIRRSRLRKNRLKKARPAGASRSP